MWQMSGGRVDLRGPGMHGLGFCSASTGEPWEGIKQGVTG